MSYDYESSLPAYKEGPEKKDFARQMVFIAICKLSPCNDRQIADHLRWPINRVTPRRGELVNEGKVIQQKKAKDPMTKRTVSWWIKKPEGYVQQSLFL
jgi:predicted transcriptional regulator